MEEHEFQPGRQQDAYASIRGIYYQIQHTILAWLNLADVDELELEYGEDIDHLIRSAPGNEEELALTHVVKEHAAPNLRILEQVKYRSGNLTLRSSETRAAIQHFMNHQSANVDADLELHFRFTTNAGAGTEQGYKRPLLELWNALRKMTGDEQKDALGELQRFLREVATSEPNSAFATLSNNPEDLLALIHLFEWRLKEPGCDKLQTEILRRCERLSETPETAQTTYARLVNAVLGFLSSKDRPVLSAELLKETISQHLGHTHELFQVFTQQLVAAGEDETARLLKSFEQQLTEIASQTDPAQKAARCWSFWEEHYGPWLRGQKLFHHSHGFVGRRAAAEELRSFARGSAKIALIEGSGGMGKSRLLMELAKVTEVPVVFLRRDTPEACFHQHMFPEGSTILVVDDGHRFDKQSELGPLVAGVARFDRFKLIVATRPTHSEALRALVREPPSYPRLLSAEMSQKLGLTESPPRG